MELKDRIAQAMQTAMRERRTERLSVLRLINAAIRDREIAMRSGEEQGRVGDAEVRQILGRMVKQRQESIRSYEEGGRLELAEKERDEIAVIEDFLPRRLGDDEVRRAVDTAVAEADASSIRDMGRVMAILKSRHSGQMDFGAVGPVVKKRLSGPAK